MRWAFLFPTTRLSLGAMANAATGQMTWDLSGKAPMTRAQGYAMAGVILLSLPLILTFDVIAVGFMACFAGLLTSLGWLIGRFVTWLGVLR